MENKTLKVSEKTHENLTQTADHFGFKVKDFSEMCIKFACYKFRKEGVTLDPIDITNDAEYRDRLVGDSKAVAARGIEHYSEWLAKLTKDQHEILKHCVKVHKEIATKATARAQREERAKKYEDGE